MHRIFWADLHNHNEIGYGQGSLARTYRLARNTLDICAFTAHGFWPDPPATDPQMVDYHLQAFDRISAQFPQAVNEANIQYIPHQFVTFIGYEWHSTAWGDFVVLFPGAEGELYRGESYPDLRDYVASRGGMLIPHHVAYRYGWRGTDWRSVKPAISPLVEVFSEHADSFERETIWPMILHSMGGSTASQTVAHQLRRGAHFGFTAGTDNHHGYPATYGEGITGVIASALTRESVWQALWARHTLACTGDRIGVSLASGRGIMGDVLPASAPRLFEVEVQPLAPIEFVALLKNGELAQMWPGPTLATTTDDGRFLTRVEWGWGRMDNPELTEWRIDLTVEGGRIARAVPCFAGGAGSVTLENHLRQLSDRQIEITSYTSRLNPRPLSGAVLELEGDGDTSVACQVEALCDGQRGGCEVHAPLSTLIADDVWGKPFARFSSPRLRIGQARSPSSLAFAATWHDPEPGERDTYMIKVQQKNGQLAWTSPMLFG